MHHGSYKLLCAAYFPVLNKPLLQSELGIPVKYIGVGETIDDLQKFDSEEFVNALFYREEERP